MKPETLTLSQFEQKILDLQKQTKNFKVTTTSSEAIIEVLDAGAGSESYLVSTLAERLPQCVLNTIKNTQRKIITHVQNRPDLLATLQHTPAVDYQLCQSFAVDKFFMLHQIDIKSAYFSAAYMLGYIPQDVKDEIDKLEETFIKKGQSPETAKINAKQARLMILGSLAKAQTETVYKFKGYEKKESESWQDFVDFETGEILEFAPVYENTTTESRTKGDEIANIFFKSAELVTQTMKGLFLQKDKEASNILFFWVDAIFCKSDALAEVRQHLTNKGFLYKEYTPVAARYSNFNYYLQSDINTPIDSENPATFKKYSFKRSQASVFMQHVAEIAGRKLKAKQAKQEVSELVRGAGDYTMMRGYEIFSPENWQKLKTRLYCFGIDANEIEISVEYFELLGEKKYLSLMLGEAQNFANKLKNIQQADGFISGNFEVKL
jgi:hypothetical protein